MNIAFVLGTRPEIIKMSPVIRACVKERKRFFILHTNQHYSKELDNIFFKDLELPSPKYNLRVGSGTHAEEIGKMMIGIEGILKKEKPSIVLAEGDTNTVLAAGIVASRLHIPLGHVEAGLRSYFREMPEEINRILTDHCSDFLFAPTAKAKSILIGEGIPKRKIFVTGNTIVDAVKQNMNLAGKKSDIFNLLNLEKNKYFFVTAHREENVDNKSRLSSIFKGLSAVGKKYKIPVVYPMHPRTKKRLDAFNLKVPDEVTVVNPVGYFDCLKLMVNARLVLTDSGGIQEETCVLKVPCVTLRNNTERPETIMVGSNILAGVNPVKIRSAVGSMLKSKKNWKNPFGDGKAGERIISIISKRV
ncbi:MAG: UDP-N-acetylglucosamine 2-epimerase (non-hydrolyzing) [bacterium]